jgi:hypothetical protein
MDLLTTQAIQSIIAEWCGRKPEFKAHIERYCMALYHRGYSSPTISECLRQGFERSDLLGALDEQLACWEGRVIKAESKLVEENVEKLNESLKHKLYNKNYAELAICALREKVKSSECNPEQLKNKDQSLKIQLGIYFNEIFKKAHPDLYAWHRESYFKRSGRSKETRATTIIEKYLAEEQDGGQQLPDTTLIAHASSTNLEVLAHAAAAQSLVNPSDSISVGLGLCARCILQFLLLPSPGIVLNLPLTA